MNTPGRGQPLEIAHWTSSGITVGDGPHFMLDRGAVHHRLAGIRVVLESGGLPLARLRLAAGARQVLLGEGALQRPALLAQALEEFGAERVGVWLPARRAPVSWALDSYSNGDFKCMVPSNPQARWDVLRADGQPAGLDASAWIDQLLGCGVTTVLLGIDMQDDRDLDLCAGLAQRHGPHLWFTSLAHAAADFAAWVEYGQVRRLVLPAGPGRAGLSRELLERFGPAATRAGMAA